MDRRCLIDGQVVAEDEARAPALDRGFLYADGLFETLRVYRGRSYRLDDHWRRMNDSARFLRLPLPELDPAALVATVLDANRIDDGSVRVTISRGPLPPGPRPTCTGLRPTVLVQARPLRPGLEQDIEHGIGARLAPWPSRARGAPLHHHKTLAYLDSVLALGETVPGEEPLLWNSHGELAEGATSNLFWVRNDTLHTPHTDAGCLPGVTRRVVLELAVEAGLKVAEGFYPTAQLASADEAFLTNAVLELAPLVRLDGQPVGDGRPGPVTRQLQQAYRRDVTAALRVP